MFDARIGDGTEVSATTAASEVAVTPEEVWQWLDQLATGAMPTDDAARIELISALERLTNAARSAQARVTTRFDASQRSEQAAAGVPTERRGRSIAGQVALARQVSPYRGQQLHGLALVLDRELPCTAAAMRRGWLSEWRAQIIARETATLSVEHRGAVDAAVAGDVERLAQRGDRELASECARLAAELDPASVVARRRKAERERNVSLRPAPDTMSWFTGLLPVTDGVAVITSLGLAADAARARGDERSRGQVMADTLVDRILGIDQTSTGTGSSAATESGSAGITWAECDMDRFTNSDNDTMAESTPVTGGAADIDAAVPNQPGVMLNLTMSYDQLVHGAGGAAWLDGYGPVDAELAREIVRQYDAWVRRLHTDPAAGGLVGMESKSRFFPGKLKDLIRLRDQQCRTPWCDAPIRHVDHAQAHDTGGVTSYANGQGLCENCNYTKQAPGWHAVMASTGHGPPGTGDIITTTPTGHGYRSPAPHQPGDPPKVRIPRPRLPRRNFPAIDIIFDPPRVA